MTKFVRGKNKMNVCKPNAIPRPYALVEWSELPCFADSIECKAWRKRVKTLPFEDPSITFEQFTNEA